MQSLRFLVSVLFFSFLTLTGCTNFTGSSSGGDKRFSGSSKANEPATNGQETSSTVPDENGNDADAVGDRNEKDRVVSEDSNDEASEAPCGMFNEKNRSKKEDVDFGGQRVPFDTYGAALRCTPQGDDCIIRNAAVFNQEGQLHTDWSGARGTHYTAFPDAKIADYKSANCKMLTGVGQNKDTPQGGCFDENAKILMANGTLRTVRDLGEGEMVFNPILRRAVAVDRRIGGPETGFMYQIGLGKDTVLVTGNHPMPTNTGIKQAQQLTLADQLLGPDGRYHPISKFRKLPAKKGRRVFNLVINENSTDPMAHMVLVDGVVAGDLWLQEKLEAKKSTLVTQGKQQGR